ncbi:MAG TPA: HipA family kinase [Chloroflexota bacterium]|nr:HipA family kinase [Chloroflexota bacterium]
MLRTVLATRYVTPLREGGSLPAIIEADDDGTYVLKFRGAGQGQRALIAELVAGEIGRALGLLVPEIVLVELDPVLARSEPDPEIQALIEASGGLNLALDYLPGSIGFDPLLAPPPDPDLAAAVVWFDAYVTNVDRTIKNPNLLLWHTKVWLIDHGASLFFHHSWDNYLQRSRAPFPRIKDHVLLPTAASIEKVDAHLARLLPREKLEEIVAAIPETWLGDEPLFAGIGEHRDAYLTYLVGRLDAPRAFAEDAEHAREQL